jgi:hypothetical protein
MSILTTYALGKITEHEVIAAAVLNLSLSIEVLVGFYYERLKKPTAGQLFRPFGGDKLNYFPAHGMADKHISIKFKRFDNFLRIRSKIREVEARRMGFRSPPAALIDCDGAQAIRKRGNNVFPGMG